LEETDLEALKNSIDTINKTKKELSSLKIAPDTQLKKTAEKIKEYKEQLKTFKKEHPYWTAALLTLLPAKFVSLFSFKEEKKSATKSS
jgi:hypothetical protein